jgi:hypothetical protein
MCQPTADEDGPKSANALPDLALGFHQESLGLLDAFPAIERSVAGIVFGMRDSLPPILTNRCCEGTAKTAPQYIDASRRSGEDSPKTCSH